MSNPILSLCIPTNGALQWVDPVIDSIFKQGCDSSLFEVIITDNAKNPELQDFVEKYGQGNLYYYQSNAQGFLNIIDSFQTAKGDYCKLINHRAKMLDGSLQKLLKLIDKHKEKQPVIYCTNGVLGNNRVEILCKDLNNLVWELHYYCTWMAGIGIWRKDLKNIEKVEFNNMFPNTTILFEQRKEDSEYLLWNEKFFCELDGQGKGCYNLFHTFAVVFPDMLRDLLWRGRITQRTFDKVMKDLYRCLQHFYMDVVLRNPDKSFDLTGIHKSITTYYSEWDYWHMMICCYKEYYKGLVKNALRDLKVKTLY